MKKLYQKSIKFLSIGALFYIAYGILIFILQRDILFPTDYARGPKGISEQIPDSAKIWIDTEYGNSETWYLAPFQKELDKPHPLIIIGHGNADVIDKWVNIVSRLREVGIGVLLVEYPGYGRSSGQPTQESITNAFIASYDSILSKPEIDPEKIILLGQSIGGGPICALAKERPSAAVILISTFTSVRTFASQYFLPEFLIRDPFDNLNVIKNYNNPVLIVHGKNDNLIPFEEGKILYAAVKNGKMISNDGGHNSTITNWLLFWDNDILPFLRKNGILLSS